MWPTSQKVEHHWSTECIFSTYDLIWSKIRKSLEWKAEKLVKIYRFTKLKKITIGIYSNCAIYSSLCFKSFKFRCCSFCLTVQVSCSFYFLLFSKFFKGKLKSVFWWVLLFSFQVGFLKKPGGFFGVGFLYKLGQNRSAWNVTSDILWGLG